MAADCAGADLVHSHTWYANLAGHLAGLLHDVPHVLSAHSLEPLRPWKAEQLGGGYALSSWAERTAYLGAAGVIAVSAGHARGHPALLPGGGPGAGPRGAQRDRPVGVERARRTPTRWPNWAWTRPARAWCSSAGSPGRRACRTCCARRERLPADVQLVLCAGAPDTPEIAAEVSGLVGRLQQPACRRGLDRADAAARRPRRQVLSAATAFVCPSVYEPLGIVNLEAMACEAAGRRHRHRRDPRGGPGRGDRPAGADRPGR